MRENRGSEFLIGEKNGSGETKGENVDRSIDRSVRSGWLVANDSTPRTTEDDGRRRRPWEETTKESTVRVHDDVVDVGVGS